MNDTHVDRGNNWLKLTLCFASCHLLAGCNHVPSQNIAGSFFPSWMLCAVVAIVLTLVIRLIIVKTGVNAYIQARLVIYLGLTTSLTFVLWLEWYGN
uniref:Uncharacterized protein YtcA n=1 Tax=Desulfovibrio sp. U5L TaxID=596152 RepID=I2PX60_9BACT